MAVTVPPPLPACPTAVAHWPTTRADLSAVWVFRYVVDLLVVTVVVPLVSSTVKLLAATAPTVPTVPRGLRAPFAPPGWAPALGRAPPPPPPPKPIPMADLHPCPDAGLTVTAPAATGPPVVAEAPSAAVDITATQSPALMSAAVPATVRVIAVVPEKSTVTFPARAFCTWRLEAATAAMVPVVPGGPAFGAALAGVVSEVVEPPPQAASARPRAPTSRGTERARCTVIDLTHYSGVVGGGSGRGWTPGHAAPAVVAGEHGEARERGCEDPGGFLWVS